jgi:hypothetical protein
MSYGLLSFRETMIVLAGPQAAGLARLAASHARASSIRICGTACGDPIAAGSRRGELRHRDRARSSSEAQARSAR